MTRTSSHKRDRLQAFQQLCHERGVSLTIQRRAVFEVLLDGMGHFTADEVHRRVRRKLPSVSKTTVYRVLDTLVELGVISKAYQPGAPAIFDVGTHPHDHLACLSCNKIVDLEEDLPGMPILPDANKHGFEITESHVFFRGTCPECQRKRRSPRGKTGKSAKRVKAKHREQTLDTSTARQSKRSKSARHLKGRHAT